jgi:hypothetical protein
MGFSPAYDEASHNRPVTNSVERNSPMTADESDDQGSRTSKLGDVVKEIINQVKPLNDLLPLIVTAVAFLGGLLLVSYATKERFFYDNRHWQQ